MQAAGSGDLKFKAPAHGDVSVLEFQPRAAALHEEKLLLWIGEVFRVI
jgi:hypothetical protein